MIPQGGNSLNEKRDTLEHKQQAHMPDAETADSTVDKEETNRDAQIEELRARRDQL